MKPITLMVEDKPILFNFKPVAVISSLSMGWIWELQFNTNDFIYKLECSNDFSTPAECEKHLDLFCEKNKIIINKKEWL